MSTPNDANTKSQGPFSNPALVATYADDTPRKVPGLADLHRMAMLLLSERAQEAAHILVVGAGGGMELKAMAEAQRQWVFTGVDPSAAMLELARRNIEPFNDRIMLIEGTVDAAQPGSFDGAACLLTLHFLDKSERLLTLKDIHRRLKPDARLVVAHRRPLPTAPALIGGRPWPPREWLGACPCFLLPKRKCCFARPASRMSSSSMPPSRSAAGWRRQARPERLQRPLTGLTQTDFQRLK
jgi:SAM-dependent methyltransferase